MAQANAGDDYNYSQISVSKQEMSAQLEKMRKDGQISEQQLKDAKAAVGGLSDDDMKDLTQKGVKQVQEGKMTTENESLVEKQMQGIQDNIKKMEDLNEKE
jgi:ribosome recycling factor